MQITRSFEIDAGHRVYGHEGKCAMIHGHRWKIEVTIENDVLDEVGRVLDYSEMKRIFGGWLDKHWDHKLLISNNDVQLRKLSSSFGRVTVPFNPTSENIAKYLFEVFDDLIEDELHGNLSKVVKVRVCETPNCWAEYIPLEIK